MQVKQVRLQELRPYEANAKKHDDRQIKNVAESIRQYGFVQPIVADRNGVIVIGHCRFLAARMLGLQEVPCVCVDDLTPEQVNTLRLVDNKSNESGWDYDLLAAELGTLDMTAFDFDWSALNKIEDIKGEAESYSLSDLFIFPTFSVLDSRCAQWRDRKEKWLNLGIDSAKGRKENITNSAKAEHTTGTCEYMAPGTSVFDPVLCEIAYKWFCPAGGSIIDPFAGGSVRGLVAAHLGYKYTGIDLRQEQITENLKQAEATRIGEPNWICGDSIDIKDLTGGEQFDMVFSCPPYADLEVYSDDPRDISNMDYPDFMRKYEQIIKNTIELLKKDRFAVFVVGDMRDKNGFYRDFISDTKRAFISNGAMLYNDIVKIDENGTAGMRARKLFRTRKCVKIHQNVLVFYKGNPNKIKQNYLDVEVMDI